jgi:uncharacterized protein
MDQRLTMVTLGVSDLKKSTEFYVNNFGWTKAGSSNDDISFFHLQGMELGLFNRHELAKDATVNQAGEGFRGFILSYNARSEREVDEIFAVLKEKGVAIIKYPGKVFWGGYSGYIADPDENLWEIAYNPFLGLDEKGRTIEA